MLSARATGISYRHIVGVSSRVRRVVQVHSKHMAPKRAAEGKEGPSKKAKSETPSFNPKWKSVKPSMLLFGDDEPGCDKVAAFDLDGTLIEWKQGQSFSLEPGSWVWFNDNVPTKLKVSELRDLEYSIDCTNMNISNSCCCVKFDCIASHIQELHDSGYKIVIFSNQATVKSALGGKAAAQIKAKVDEILAGAGVPATVYAATLKDENRKPKLGMWTQFTQNSNDGKEVDKESSYYVGDAAGRPDDFAGTDKEFAEAIGLPFKVPENVFGAGMCVAICMCTPSHLGCSPPDCPASVT